MTSVAKSVSSYEVIAPGKHVQTADGSLLLVMGIGHMNIKQNGLAERNIADIVEKYWKRIKETSQNRITQLGCSLCLKILSKMLNYQPPFKPEPSSYSLILLTHACWLNQLRHVPMHMLILLPIACYSFRYGLLSVCCMSCLLLSYVIMGIVTESLIMITIMKSQVMP